MDSIPQLGLGTRKLHWNQAFDTVKNALQIGYRHFDTARIYGNEKEVWTAIKNSWIPREEVRITTKIWFYTIPNPSHHHRTASDFSYSQFSSRFEQSLTALKTDIIDLVLLHRPTNPDTDTQAFESLLQLKKAWKIRHLGVANFPPHQLEKLFSHFWNEIFTNQIEWHPCLASPKLEQFSKEKNLILTAYSPLGHGHLLQHPPLLHLAQVSHCSVAQLCLARLLAKWAVVIPKASSFARLEENFEAQRISLPTQVIAEIDQLPKHYRYCNPPFAPKWD